MAKKITYLLGAGASANAIPIVTNMHKRLNEVIDFLKSSLPASKTRSIERFHFEKAEIIARTPCEHWLYKPKFCSQITRIAWG